MAEAKTRLRDQPAAGKKGGNWHFRGPKKSNKMMRRFGR